MVGSQESQKQEIHEIINKIINHIKRRVEKSELPLIEVFAHRFFGSSALNDLITRSTEELSGILLSHWNFIFTRKAEQTKVRVFNPTLEEDGWNSTHTIIQISNDDIPFLVDSIRLEVNRSGVQIHFTIHFGGTKVLRNDAHQIVKILPVGSNNPNATSEAPIYFEIDRQTDEEVMETLRGNIERVLGDVKIAVVDWRKMVERAEESLIELEQNPPPLDPAEIAESKDFLRWLINNHFTFLGCRDYKLIGTESNRALQIIPGTGLGVLRDDSVSTISKSYADMPPQARRLALSKTILIIAKTNTRSTVHRDAYTDYIGVKRFNEKGELVGERRFIGLYTSTAYHSSPRHIPFLRHKVAKVIQQFHFPPDSHSGKEVVHIMETLPRDDLFQATNEELFELTIGILHLQERKQIRLFVRKDAYGRYFSCLVYLPREIFNTELTLAIQDVLIHSFQGIESSFTSYFSDSVLARIHYIIRVNPKLPIEYNVSLIENKIIAVARSWTDELKTYLLAQFGEANGLKIYNKYRKAFPASYTECYLPSAAIEDIRQIEALSKESPLGMLFFKTGETSVRLKLFHTEHTIALSDVLPTLENMGLRVIGERPHELLFKDGSLVWITDFDMVYNKNTEIDINHVKHIFQEAFAHIWFGNVEDDKFNVLVLAAELTWRETAILRAYTKYLRQIRFTFSQAYIEQAIGNNPDIARDLVSLFKLRFSPDQFERDPSDLIKKIEQGLEAVSSLDEDRIIRRLLELIMATTRTNYFQTNADGSLKTYLSFKFNPELISELPLPRPVYEIFVYAPSVEGVHLRGGKVARGGIRWSDRPEDFRTEVLGLMKAQQVKNSVIVPVGAKGGFFPKKLPDPNDRDAYLKAGISAYQIFIRALLDITDNIGINGIIVPNNVVRYDEDDTYLVVAADKGTATFSDIANNISAEYGFWLGDAFASGGSSGYDHKKMGITARGAWESVTRHFREIDIDPSRDDFTVIGIGDMSGDVFGNGMLLSNHIKLVGAFNHQNIFLDPNPHAEKSFAERKRLFNLPRSTWLDYDQSLISPGGGIYNRSAKSIKLSPEIRSVLAIDKEILTPNEVIRALLKAPVDLIWNGGIGTYVKAVSESHLDVGDRNNDNVRVDGHELRARVVGEGGNLGFTQLGRIEYSLHGGIINTDFIDNSGGVDCSDHEVNIKILLNKIVAEGKMSLEERNQLLAEMTDEVAELVLRDNYEQTQMLSLEASVASITMDLFRNYMTELERAGRLNRHLEYLPDEKALVERKKAGQALTRAEIAILLAYCKMYLKQDILKTDIPDEPYFTQFLKMAFPHHLTEQYLAELKEHRLRREIIATQLGKNLTDHMGINFVERLQRETGRSLAFILRSYVIVDGIYRMDTLWKEIEALDYKVKTSVQQKMMLQLYYLIRRATRWFLRMRKPDINIEQTIKDFSKPISELIDQLPELLTQNDRDALSAEIQLLVAEGVPEKLARATASCNTLFTSLDIVEAARKHNFTISEVAKTYYLMGTHLQLNWLREQISLYPRENQWDELARSGLRDDLDWIQRNLSVSVLSLKTQKVKSVQDQIDLWIEEHSTLVNRWENLIDEIKTSNNTGFVTYSVILRELSAFVGAGLTELVE